MEHYSRSKKFAIAVFVCTFFLSAFCAWQGLEGATSAVFSTGTLASTGLYANKQWTDKRKLEIEKGNSNG
jgi:hypothetical protein